ncbi:MAG TPA: site-specific integrase [Saprospiraceae bacterium]|nr:site-specific integrase [Saprospiraceae bacterium]
MKNKVSVKVILDKRRPKKNGIYPVKLRVTYQREQKYFPTNYDLNEEDFEKITNGTARGDLKEIRLRLNSLEVAANATAEHLPSFTFSRFEAQLFAQSDSKDFSEVNQLYDAIIDRLVSEKRLNTAESYKYSKISISKFSPRLKVADVTPEFLRDYQKHMEANGASRTTIGFYLRCLRAVINEAIALGHLSKELYPFGRRQYQIPASRNVKKSLTTADVQKIMNYKPLTESEEKARDLWLFSYFCNGMNIKDIAQLRYRNIDSEREMILFVRAKTEYTQREGKSVNVVLLPQAKAIIKRWGIKPSLESSYVFPVLSDSMSAEQQLSEKNLLVKLINKYMKRIGQKLGIQIKLTTYVARHTFATVLKRSGAPIEFISESLGHKDMRTTENYLDSFEDVTKRQYAQALVNFEKA